MSIIATAGAIIASLWFYEKLPFTDPEVIGFANRMGALGLCAVFVLMLLFVIVLLIEGFQRKYPILGAPGHPGLS